MAELQKVRFTGRRTDTDSQVLPGIGLVRRRQEVWIDPVQADSITVLHPTADGEESDWELVGDVTKFDDDELEKLNQRQQERGGDVMLSAREEAGIFEELAHPIDPAGRTAEEEGAIFHAERQLVRELARAGESGIRRARAKEPKPPEPSSTTVSSPPSPPPTPPAAGASTGSGTAPTGGNV